MPASNSFYLQDARNNFGAVRPAPICSDGNQSMGQSQNVHVSTNCYYGYHDLKNPGISHVDADCEMVDLSAAQTSRTPSTTNAKKRCAEEQSYPQTKRLREDDSSMCSLVGTRSSPSHSASAFNDNTPTVYSRSYRLVVTINYYMY